ncbi:hypothetical protein SDC9_31170 [bioreactor metagenome]|jgi:lipoate-protein ligase A|uniref:BPL/LPL catalytic domain-containing protein n=1 Tax=bioreactor metagenome TaxID=1076179 RepID=A0A644V2X0_9ZZZZ|nr:hypothetical protein [Bacteroidales bacterium]MBP8677725.1 hypothetical protein [Bacteroidales bacterium]
MMPNQITALPYSLPDADILLPDNSNRYKIWVPDRIYIVLGRSNNVENALIKENVLQDDLIVMQRPSGGETVILTPSTLVFSIKFPLLKRVDPQILFKTINNSLIEEFISAGVEGVYSKGISDLSIENQKIMGSSMYLKDNQYFYHAVLNISEDPALFSRYLKHPGKEPDYRKGRSHSEFVTSLWKKGYIINEDKSIEIIRRAIEKTLRVISFTE